MSISYMGNNHPYNPLYNPSFHFIIFAVVLSMFFSFSFVGNVDCSPQTQNSQLDGKYSLQPLNPKH